MRVAMKNCDKREIGITLEQALYINDLLEDELRYQEEFLKKQTPFLVELVSTIDEILGTFQHTGHAVTGPDEDEIVNICCHCFDENEFEPEQEVARLIDGNGDTVECFFCGTDIK